MDGRPSVIIVWIEDPLRVLCEKKDPLLIFHEDRLMVLRGKETIQWPSMDGGNFNGLLCIKDVLRPSTEGSLSKILLTIELFRKISFSEFFLKTLNFLFKNFHS